MELYKYFRFIRTLCIVSLCYIFGVLAGERQSFGQTPSGSCYNSIHFHSFFREVIIDGI